MRILNRAPVGAVSFSGRVPWALPPSSCPSRALLPQAAVRHDQHAYSETAALCLRLLLLPLSLPLPLLAAAASEASRSGSAADRLRSLQTSGVLPAAHAPASFSPAQGGWTRWLRPGGEVRVARGGARPAARLPGAQGRRLRREALRGHSAARERPRPGRSGPSSLEQFRAAALMVAFSQRRTCSVFLLDC